MPKKRKVEKKSTDELKHQIGIIGRELSHLVELQWTYSKRLLKFGFASWAFGVAAFSFSLIFINPWLITNIQPITICLLILAAIAPVVITLFLIQKFHAKIKHLERIRRKLLAEYEVALLKRVRGMI